MTTKTKESKKIRDLIRIGVFSALWIAVSWIIGCTVGFFPPIMLALPCILAVAGTLILVVMLSKVNIPGGILISSFLFGICLFSMVPYGLMFLCTFAGGIIGEIIYDTIGKKSNTGKVIALSFPMFGLALGEYIPLCYMQEAFKSFYADRITGSVADSSMELINTPLVIVLTVITVICAIFGYLWGKKIVAKRMANQGGHKNEKIKK